MSGLAYLVMVHKNAEQVRHLLESIHDDGNYYLIHIDAKAPMAFVSEIAQIVKERPNRRLMPSQSIRWGGWEMVAVELEAMRLLMEWGDWTHFLNLSGQDFPLVTQNQLRRDLDAAGDRSFMLRFDPVAQWGELPSLRRYQRRNVWIGRRHVPLPLPRSPRLRRDQWVGSSQWKILSRAAVEYVLDAPESVAMRRNFQHGFIPDECYVPTVLFGSPLADRIDPDYKRYIDWSDGPVPPPQILHLKDLRSILESGAYFARKFDATVDADILDALTARLEELRANDRHRDADPSRRATLL